MIGEKIKVLRKEKGISQKDFAQQTGVSISYIQQLERGVKDNPSMDILEKISKVLNVSMYEFLSTDTLNLHNEIVKHESTSWIMDAFTFCGWADDPAFKCSRNLMSIIDKLRYAYELQDKEKALKILEDTNSFIEFSIDKHTK